MMRRKYIRERLDWPEFRWEAEALLALLIECRYRQGLLLGALASLGFPALERPALETLVNEVASTSAIEGETPDADQVRSSLARRLGVEHDGVPVVDRRVEGISAVMLDATSSKLNSPGLARQHGVQHHLHLVRSPVAGKSSPGHPASLAWPTSVQSLPSKTRENVGTLSM